MPWIQRARRGSNHASPSPVSPNAASRSASRRRTSSRLRPISVPTIAERVSVDGSRPAARSASTSAAYRWAATCGLADDRLNSSAQRAAMRYERGVPDPPTRIRGLPSRPGYDPGRGRNRASSTA